MAEDPKQNPYYAIAAEFAGLLERGRELLLGDLSPVESPVLLAPDAPTLLIFSPHPDDECITGGLPLRMMREYGAQVINVAVTQGSDKARQTERWAELKQACTYLGFDLIQTRENGLEQINLATRERQPEVWAPAVAVIIEILLAQQPDLILIPHAKDWNSTHIGVHYLLLDTLAQLGPEVSCTVVETEFWGAMDSPNLMVELGLDIVADLMAALSFHRGEVLRNPFHLRLPAWLMDNVRRGSELVGGQGQAAPNFVYAMLYRIRRWQQGRLRPLLDKGLFLSCEDDVAQILGDFGK